jgi:uncharacterized protein
MVHADLPARYAPEIPFPDYAFVPGRHPHPITDPQGHGFGQAEVPLPAIEPAALGKSPQFRHAVDLFNHGYYWEAHEVWEGFWHASGRRGRMADFLKGLIRLAAAGVKAREGNRKGVIRHGERAAELFEQTGSLEPLQFAKKLISHPTVDSTFTTQGHPVLPIQLRLEDLELS